MTVPSSKTSVENFINNRLLKNAAHLYAANFADYSTVVQTNSLNDRSVPCQRTGYWILNSSIRNDDAPDAAFQCHLRTQHFLLHTTLRRFTRRSKLTLRQLPNQRGLIWEILHQPRYSREQQQTLRLERGCHHRRRAIRVHIERLPFFTDSHRRDHRQTAHFQNRQQQI